jgi:hypothetical protein
VRIKAGAPVPLNGADAADAVTPPAN